MAIIDPTQMAPWKCPVWIISTPRVGSTLLCYRLNAAVGLPTKIDYRNPNPPLNVFAEHFHPDLAKTGYKANTNRPYVTKFMAHWKNKLGTKLLWPETKFIHLTRRNFQAQVESRVLAELWGKWQAHSKSEQYQYRQFAKKAKGTPEYERVLQHYLWEGERFRKAGHTFARSRPKGTVINVTYEEIADERPVASLEEIFEFIGFKPDEYEIKLNVGLYKTGL